MLDPVSWPSAVNHTRRCFRPHTPLLDLQWHRPISHPRYVSGLPGDRNGRNQQIGTVWIARIEVPACGEFHSRPLAVFPAAEAFASGKLDNCLRLFDRPPCYLAIGWRLFGGVGGVHEGMQGRS